MRQNIVVNDIKTRFRLLANVTYAQHYSYDGLRQLTMDLLLPDIVRDRTGSTNVETKALPLIVFVVGGGFKTTNKDRWIPALHFFTEQGFAAASVEYRTSNEALFPAAVQDIKSAIRYLRKFAGKYGIDKDSIFLMGDSAGGYLATMAGLTSGMAAFNNSEWPDEDDSVKAVCNMFGPTDLARDGKGDQSPSRLFIGGSSEQFPSACLAADPLNYITPDSPPFLIFHGTADTLVGIEHSDRLYTALQAAGVSTDFYVVEGGGHDTVEFGQAQVLQIIASFFKRYLKP